MEKIYATIDLSQSEIIEYNGGSMLSVIGGFIFGSINVMAREMANMGGIGAADMAFK